MYTYYPNKVCSKKIDIDIENGVIKEVIFHGGCPGNLLGISNGMLWVVIIFIMQ